MSRPRVPERILRAADELDLAGDERVLELGCGRGVAAELLLARHPGLRYLAVDRSAAAVAAAAARNAAAIAQGRLRTLCCPLEELGPDVAPEGPFDVVFAINVHLFWTTTATAVAQSLADLMRPGARLWLFFEGPSGAGRAAAPALRSLDVPDLSAEADEDGPLTIVRATKRAA
ncbi:class I SAM-dependent methyltransferase [Georgenia thermotolerans]|uniref:Methyltransferase domain-containing protein n=1 Tax=Georgenia thermotolerans TaxID=527326 RepID=A0A7J5USE8_9MICO|nr:class I SAM-dependent methyltransferase [Georgenia thermotolerans]KAE8765084.1 methyltransferase domain-containing protein [Georgenia thermotolerans]